MKFTNIENSDQEKRLDTEFLWKISSIFIKLLPGVEEEDDSPFGALENVDIA